jgi:hypothetical protein
LISILAYYVPANVDLGIHNYANQHLEYAVEFISQTINKYPYDKLVSPPYPLRQLSTAIDAAFSQEYLRISVTP